MTDRPQPHLRRRTFAGIATIGLGLPVLAACSGGDGSGVATDPNTPSPSSTPTASGSTDATPSESASSAPAAFTQTSDIEVGGGTIFPEDQVVITQPSDGEFKCFSAVCTHQGCIVSSVQAGGIRCECHGSAFSIEDGSAVNPPATVGLDEVEITVEGDEISIA